MEETGLRAYKLPGWLHMAIAISIGPKEESREMKWVAVVPRLANTLIGKSYYVRFGLAFKLNGLGKTNSNALNRPVVLHAHECMPDHEVAEEVCQSN